MGCYADSVAAEMATFSNGWEKRLVPSRTKNAGGVTDWCVEIHDLTISKLAAGPDKDLAYIRALLKRKLVKRGTLSGNWPIQRCTRHIGTSCWKRWRV